MSQPSYEQVRRQIASRYAHRFWFIAHVITAVIANVLILAGGGTPAFTLIWAGVVLVHGINLWLEERRDREIERTWERLGGSAASTAKPKRDRLPPTARLSDDGELETDLLDFGDADTGVGAQQQQQR
jgi:hypothetical protein